MNGFQTHLSGKCRRHAAKGLCSESCLDNGSWRVRWRDGDGTNRSRTFDTAKDASKWLAHVRRATAFNEAVEKARTDTLGDAVAAWWARKAHLALRTRESYEAALKHAQPLMPKRLDAIRHTELASLLAALPWPTAVKLKTVLGQVFAEAVRDGTITANPATGIRLTGAKSHYLAEALSHEQVGLLAEHVSEPYKALVLVGAYAGLRIGEALGLAPEHIDEGSRTIRVERQWDHVAKAFTAPKTKAGTRTVPFADRLSEPLSKHLADSAPKLVFANGDGSPLHANNFRTRQWRKAAAAIGLPDLHYHDLRHTYASLLISKGVNVALVAKLMGHANPSVTLRVYSHCFAEDYGEAREALD